MAASTFVASGTYTTPTGAAASGTVTFLANNHREVNTNTIQDSSVQTATLANGVLSQALVVNVGGYTVTENIANAAPPIVYVIPGTTNIDLSTVDASLANFDASDVVNVVPGQTVTGTTYTFVLSDGADVIKRFTNASAVTATVDGSASIPVGTIFNGVQMGAGRVTVVGTNGAVIRGASNAVTSRVQWSPFSLRKDSSTLWVISGDIS